MNLVKSTDLKLKDKIILDIDRLHEVFHHLYKNVSYKRGLGYTTYQLNSLLQTIYVSDKTNVKFCFLCYTYAHANFLKTTLCEIINDNYIENIVIHYCNTKSIILEFKNKRLVLIEFIPTIGAKILKINYEGHHSIIFSKINFKAIIC